MAPDVLWPVLSFKPKSSPERFAYDTTVNTISLYWGSSRQTERETGFLLLRQKMNADLLNERETLQSSYPFLHLKTTEADCLKNGIAVVSALCV